MKKGEHFEKGDIFEKGKHLGKRGTFLQKGTISEKKRSGQTISFAAVPQLTRALRAQASVQYGTDSSVKMADEGTNHASREAGCGIATEMFSPRYLMADRGCLAGDQSERDEAMEVTHKVAPGRQSRARLPNV